VLVTREQGASVTTKYVISVGARQLTAKAATKSRHIASDPSDGLLGEVIGPPSEVHPEWR
jgi:hypothetical protein